MLVAKIGKKTTEETSREVEAAVIKFVDIKEQIDKLTVVLKEQKEILVKKGEAILEDSEASSVTLGVGDDNVNIKFDWDIKVDNEKKLRAVIGDRFSDLVTTKTVFTPTAKLKGMALEDDGLKECLSVKPKAPAFKIVR